MAEIAFLPSALDDLDEIRAAFGASDPRAASALVDRLLNRLVLLRDFPEAAERASQRVRGVRRLSEPPYAICYRRDGELVLILRVLHGARRVTPRMLRPGRPPYLPAATR